METFEKNIRNAFVDSEYDLAMKNQKTDPEYQRLWHDYEELIQRVREKMDKENQKIVFALDVLKNEINGMENDWIYQQGLIDCITLLKMLHLFNG